MTHWFSQIARRLAFVLLSMAFAAPLAAVTTDQHRQMGIGGVERHIRPGFAALLAAAEAQQGALAGYCAEPGKGQRPPVDLAFRDAVLAFGRIEHLRFGPLVQDGRLERMLFWPDRKGLGARQVEVILTRRDRAATSAAGLAGKSAAVQGLNALELVLYGGDWSDADEAAFRCAYARAIADSFAGLARQLVADWSERSRYVQLWRQPDESSDVFVDHSEVSRTLFISLLTGIKLIRDFKLAQPLGESLERARPKAAAFWRSGLATEVLAANVEGVRNLFRTVFAAPIDAGNPGAAEGVDLDFRQLLFALQRLPLPLGEAAADATARAALVELRAIAGKIQQEGGGAAAKATDQLLGFNALDGD